MPELKTLVLNISPLNELKVKEDLKKIGKVRFAILTGIFVSKDNFPIDIFIIGDDINQDLFKEFISELEAEVGKEVNYTLMDTSEFTYRYNIYDRFIRNILSAPNKVLIDELKIIKQ